MQGGDYEVGGGDEEGEESTVDGLTAGLGRFLTDEMLVLPKN